MKKLASLFFAMFIFIFAGCGDKSKEEISLHISFKPETDSLILVVDLLAGTDFLNLWPVDNHGVVFGSKEIIASNWMLRIPPDTKAIKLVIWVGRRGQYSGDPKNYKKYLALDEIDGYVLSNIMQNEDPIFEFGIWKEGA